MESVNQQLLQLKKSRRREWFLTGWKPQIDTHNNYIWKGSDNYDNIKDLLFEFEGNYTGAKWAYAIHNKGQNIDKYQHEDCEHIHVVLVTENAVSGASIMKRFKGWHIEPIRMHVENCARYLLHISSSSFGKEKVGLDNLYCNGVGEHGQIWFSLVPSELYETFSPNECLHYVYNEGMHTLLDFVSRFGGSVLHGAYGSCIKTTIDMYNKRTVTEPFFLAIWHMLDEDKKEELMLQNFDYGDRWGDDKFRLTLSEHDIYMSFADKPINMFFNQLYIWYRNCSKPANNMLLALMKMYRLYTLIKLNDERTALNDMIVVNRLDDTQHMQSFDDVMLSYTEGLEND